MNVRPFTGRYVPDDPLWRVDGLTLGHGSEASHYLGRTGSTSRGATWLDAAAGAPALSTLHRSALGGK
jgi:hypothetical protein